MSFIPQKLKRFFETDFDKTVRNRYGDHTLQEIKSYLNKLQLPVPEKGTQYFYGRTGFIIFINRYGVVIRMEEKDDDAKYICRVNDSDFILKPLSTQIVGDLVAEVCPGYHRNTTEKSVLIVKAMLKDEGIHFYDNLIENVGLSPFKTPEFPEGRPTLIDRLSVSRLTEATNDIRQALANREASIEDKAYAPLVQAFADAWPTGQSAPDKDKTEKCWQLCAQFKAEGKLVTGWNEREHNHPATIAGKSYDKCFRKNKLLSFMGRALIPPGRVL